MRTLRILALPLLALVVPTGCAYFNTLYNARMKYDEAQAQKRAADPERLEISKSEERLYTESFEKAAKVVKYYPDSKYVDDALLLMGKANGALEGNVHLRAPEGTPMANVFLSLMHRIGHDRMASFGDSTGEFALTFPRSPAGTAFLEGA